MPHISVVSPVYKAESSIDELLRRLIKELSKITHDFEILLVEDGSPDNSWKKIEENCIKDQRVKGIRLSRNFGQHKAITAGLDYVMSDWVIVMDCDLQDRPEGIERLYKKAQDGFDVVIGRRYIRKDKFFKVIFSKFFYRVFDYFTEGKSDIAVANFGIYSKKIINNLKKLKEQNRAFPLFIRWLGFNVYYVDIEHGERLSGKSSYNFSKLFNLAIDSIVSQSNKPLKISIKFGFFLSFVSFIYGVYLIIRYFYLNIPIGWTSVMVSIFFIGGLLFANLGLLGLYIGKIFDETKNRPLYIIKDMVGHLN